MPNFTAYGGIYIHVPFCLRKCRYCDFYSVSDLDQIATYAAALRREIVLTGNLPFKADTLYFGGGTPSLMPVGDLAQIIDEGCKWWHLGPDAEISMEVNPATLEFNDLKYIKKLGINRLNIGVQSFNPDNLNFLGRIHTPSQAKKVIHSARRAGFENLGIDMMFGLPGQTPTQWAEDLYTAIMLSPDHLSCYMLSYEPGTPLHSALLKGHINALEDDGTADLFRLSHQILVEGGYEHYEISNFAKRGFRSRHNQKYWKLSPYLGLGPAAHSFSHPNRWWNHRALERYLQDIHSNKRPIEGEEHLTTDQQIMEALFLGLRQSDGLDFTDLAEHFKGDALMRLQRNLDRWEKSGHLGYQADRICLTLDGMLISDYIIGDLISA